VQQKLYRAGMTGDHQYLPGAVDQVGYFPRIFSAQPAKVVQYVMAGFMMALHHPDSFNPSGRFMSCPAAAKEDQTFIHHPGFLTC
jgi:hypothetical protein